MLWASYLDTHYLISILPTHEKLRERGVCTVPLFQRQVWHDKKKIMFRFNTINHTIIFIFSLFVLGISVHLSLLQTRKQIKFLSVVFTLLSRVEYLGKYPLH